MNMSFNDDFGLNLDFFKWWISFLVEFGFNDWFSFLSVKLSLILWLIF